MTGVKGHYPNNEEQMEKRKWTIMRFILQVWDKPRDLLGLLQCTYRLLAVVVLQCKYEPSEAPNVEISGAITTSLQMSTLNPKP